MKSDHFNTVLIVEDDLPLSNLLKKSLVRNNFEVEICNSGKSALEIIIEKKELILLVDYNLPDLRAPELIRKLREQGKNFPFIVMTGGGDIHSAVEMMKLGARDFLIKDIDFISLIPEVVKKVRIDILIHNRLKEAEIQIAEKDEQVAIFKTFAEEAGQGFGMSDQEGKIVYMNNSLKQLLKIPSKLNIHNLKVSEFYPDHSLKIIRNKTKELRKTKQQWIGEVEVKSMSDEKIPVIQNIFCIDREDKDDYTGSLITDIREQKKTSELLKLQSTTLEASANAIVITNSHGDIVWINPAFTKLTGFMIEDVIYKNVNLLRSGMQSKEFYANLWKTIKRGKVWHGEIQNRRKNGEIYFEEQTITPILNDNGEIINFISIKQDITRRKEIEEQLKNLNEKLEERVARRTAELNKANEALKESEEKFRTLFENSSDAVMLMDKNGFFDCNSATLNMFDCAKREDFLSKKLEDFSPEKQGTGEDSKILERKLKDDALKKGQLRFEWDIKTINGDKKNTDISFTVMHFGSRKVIQAVIRDITEMKKAQTALRNAEAQLRETEKMAALGEMVAGVAHEINTPIGIGVTAASLLKDKTKVFQDLYSNGTLKKSDLEKYIDKADSTTDSILSNLKRAADLVSSFKQVAVDQSNFDQRMFKLKEYIDEILLSLKPKLKKTNHKITVNCNNELKIKSFPGAFAQIFTNLIMNSLLHGFNKGESGEIKISCIKENNILFIEYSDNGKGINKVDLNKIYDPFYTTRRSEGGTGLGLNIVYNLVTQQLGGTISCESELGKGSTFSINIPLIND